MGRMPLDQHLPPSRPAPMSMEAQDFLLSRAAPPTDEELDAAKQDIFVEPERRIIGRPEDVAKHTRLEDMARGVVERHGLEYTPQNARSLLGELSNKYATDSRYWRTNDQRENARADYALQGQSPAQVQQRYKQSRRLMPPEQRAVERGVGRDMRLLRGLLESRPPELVMNNYADEATSDMVPIRAGVTDDSGVFDVLQDPETMTGDFMSKMNYGVDGLRLYLGGEADGVSDALRQAEGLQNFRRNYRPGTATPVVGGAGTYLDANAKQDAISRASSPSGRERWQRFLGDSYPTTGAMSYVMPAVESLSDLALEIAGDPTILASGAGLAPASRGLLRNLARNAPHTARDLMTEFASEAPVGLAFQAMEGPVDAKSPEELEAAKQMRRSWFGLQDEASPTYNRRVAPTVGVVSQGHAAPIR